MVPHHPARLAYIHLMLVTAQHQPLQQQLTRTIRNQTIALHLAQPQTTSARTTFGRLARQDGTGSRGSRVHLVLHHVLEALVVDGAEEDVRG